MEANQEHWPRTLVTASALDRVRHMALASLSEQRPLEHGGERHLGALSASTRSIRPTKMLQLLIMLFLIMLAPLYAVFMLLFQLRL